MQIFTSIPVNQRFIQSLIVSLPLQQHLPEK